jgi:hypothetical protein
MTETLPQERGEHETVPLGLFSALGFLSLLLALMACGVFEPNPRLCSLADRLKYPAILSVLLILLSVSHGFSNFIAVHISPSIRVYARVSIFINFFGLYASAVIIDGCYGAFAPHGSVLRKSVALLFVLFLLFLGVCDQKNTIAGETDSYAQTWKAQIPRFEELRSLVGTVEKRLAKDAMVYQLPATLPIDKADYWHLYQLAPYAVSHHLRWSFAPFTFTDRASDWHNGVRRMPPEQFLDAILKAGFKGVWIDKSRYIEEQSDSETVRYLLGHEGVSVIDSAPNGLYSFVDLTSIPVSVQSVLDAGPVELLAASSDFLSPAWVGKNAQTERDGEHRYKVQLAPDGVFEQSVPMATVAGDKLAGSLEVSSPEKCNVTVYLKRGDVGPFDGEIRTIALSPGEPSVFELSHTFVKSWDSVIFGVGAPKGATLFIKNAQLKRVEPTAPPSTK